MPKVVKERQDFSELNESLADDIVHGGLITPGAAVNVNVQPFVGTLGGVDFESVGATNLATAAPGTAGESIRYNIVSDDTGTVSAVAGAAATTGSQVAPALAAGTVLLGTVDVANGAASIVQSDIKHIGRNWL